MKKEFYYIIVIVVLVMVFGFVVFDSLQTPKEKITLRELPEHRITKPLQEKKIPKEPVKKIELEEDTLAKDEVQEPSVVQEIIEVEEEVIEIEPMMVEVVSPAFDMMQTPREDERSDAIRKELFEELDKLYAYCDTLQSPKQNKKKFLQDLEKFTLTSIDKTFFVADFEGNTLLGSNSYEDIDGRSIVLEQIQQVRKNDQGFLVSDIDGEGLKRYMAVKNLEKKRLYIGVDIFELE